MEHVLQNEYYKATKCLTCSNCGKTIKIGEIYQNIYISDGYKAQTTLKYCQNCGLNSKYNIGPYETDEQWLQRELSQLECLENEVWKQIPDFKGYEISNLGRVRSLPRIVSLNNNRSERVSGKILSITINPKKFNRCYVSLRKSGVKNPFKRYVHRLVGEAFIPNPDNMPVINHKDENPLNNCVDNLEWCTQQYNTTYGSAIQKRIKSNPKVKPVVMLNANGEFEKEFESSAEAARYIGGNGSNVWAVCNKRAETYKGKIFVYKDEWLIKEGYFNKEYLV